MVKKKSNTDDSVSDSFDADFDSDVCTDSESELKSDSTLKNTATIFIKLQDDADIEIRYVYHLSDIHIRNSNQRQIEYSEVFEKTYKKLRSVIGQNKKISLIVLTGDILHAKTELSPESISMTYFFLKKLSDIANVIVIPGNHDTNLSNRQRLDALSPIINDIGKLPNVYYLKNSGFYLYNNIIFGVTSIFDQILLTANKMTADICKNISKYKHKYKIGLYHGAVHSAETDVGFRMNREDLLVEHFKGYDYVFLGDIHKFQYMNENKTIAYSGSLIQQSYGESIDNHGVLQWDLKNGESKLLEIKNDYGYCTVRIINGEIEPGTRIPLKPKIRFILENTNEMQYQEVVKKIEKEYDLCEIIKESNFRTKLCQNHLNNNTKNKKKNTKLAYNTQEDIIRGYLTKKKLDTDKIDSIIDLHKKIHQKILAQKQNNIANIGSVGLSKNQTWKIVELKFSNTLSYGKDNVIDFRNYEPNQIIGIMAPNRYGKSAILDIILFCLFDKMSRGERRDILNKNQNKMYCSLLFRIGKVHYLIERIGQRSKNGLSVKIDVNFYQINTDTKMGIENKEKLNGLDKNDTNKKIIDLIGDYTDYLTTCFCLQSTKSNNFIDMTQLQKKEYLNEILKLNVFEDCHNVAKDKLKELTGQMKLLEKQIGNKTFAEIKESIEITTKEVRKLTSNQTVLQTLISENLDYMLEIHEQLPLNNYNDLREYTLESEFDISSTIEKLTLELEHMPHINTQKINSKINNMNTKLEEIEKNIVESNCEANLEKMRNKLEKLLLKFINISPTMLPMYEKLDIKELNLEKDTVTNRITQINKMLSNNFCSDLTDKITQISNLVKEINDLKKQIKPINIQNILYSLDDEITLKINPHTTFINSQFDAFYFLHIYDVYYASNNIQIEKTQHQIKIMDQQKKHILLNIKDIENYISTVGDDISLLEKILFRDNMWIKKYNVWRKRMIMLCEENTNTISPDKKFSVIKNNINESASQIVSSTIDTINHLDNYVINKKIEAKEKKLSNLSEYSTSKKTRDNLNHELENLQQQLTICVNNIANVEEYSTNIKHNNEIQLQVDDIKSSIKQTKSVLKQFENEKDKLKKEIQEQVLLVKNNTEIISRRSKLSTHIKLLDEYQTIFITWHHKCTIYNKYAKLKKKAELEVSEITMLITHKKIELDILKKEMDCYLLSRKEFDDKSDEINLYQLYVASMDYNGLPYEILKDYLPMIGADINQILHSMVNFDIEFMFHDESQIADQKNKNLKSNAGCININLCHKGMHPYNVQLASGFEKFIIGLAIRMTLSQISLTAKPNFLIIDEGWSCLDSEYKNDISAIMSYIKNQYDHVIIISHLEELKSQVDYIINIDRVNNYSYVDTCRNKSVESKKIKSKKPTKPIIISI